jgi:hypothetical protein
MIRFMAPDLPSPSGGIKVIYNYVEHLVALGYDARVWHGTPGFAYDHDAWDSTAPVDTGRHLAFEPGDMLVIPETGGSKWGNLARDAPIVVLCQGMDFVFANDDFLDDLPGGYPGRPRAVATIAVSEAIATFLERACTPGFPVYRVPVEIEESFRPLPKERRIALMPRRRREDLLGAVHLIRRSGRLAGWELVLIDGMTQAEVAEELGHAARFLFGAEREGFGLPGAEAMAAGCYVVGFTGDGAKEYMLPDCCSVVPDSDVVAMADYTLAAMDQFDHDRDALQQRIDIGRDRVLARHSSVRVRAMLGEVFGELTGAGSPALMTQAATLPHYQAYAPRYGALGAAYRGSRRTARRLADRVGRPLGRSLSR